MSSWFDPKSIVDALHASVVFSRRAQVLAQHLADAMPNRGRVLDIGSGDGSVAAGLMRLRPDLKVEGIEVAIRPRSYIPISRYDGISLPFDDKSFDFVSIVDVLHHTSDPVAVLVEAARVARQVVVVKDHLREGFLAGPTLRFMDWVGNRRVHAATPGRYFGRDQWQGAFYQARLTTISTTESLGLYPAPLGWWFDRQLHFVAILAPRPAA
jgi:SAM-dependent methyltransferase